jgi:glutamine amidotransferase
MGNKEVVVVDYGVGNLLSVRRGLEYCGAQVVQTSDPDVVLRAGRVVLPGVGAFKNAMSALRALNLIDCLRETSERGTPLLGICLGMQLLLDESEEFGVTQGIGIIPGRVVAIPKNDVNGSPQHIPHIGWNELRPSNGGTWVGTPLERLSEGSAVYFVHSFMSVPADPEHRLADCVYGGHRIAAVVRSEATTGCQFHPEKSGEVGLRILQKFCDD